MLGHADVIVLNKCDLVDDATRATVRSVLADALPGVRTHEAGDHAEGLYGICI